MRTQVAKVIESSYGHQASYLSGDPTAYPTTLEQFDGHLCQASTAGVGESGFLSAPLHCSLSYAEKLIPLFLLGGIRLQFTMDTLANMCSNLGTDLAATLTGFTITNFEGAQSAFFKFKNVRVKVVWLFIIKIEFTKIKLIALH